MSVLDRPKPQVVDGTDKRVVEQYMEDGLQVLREGRMSVCILAGGKATRMGCGPKGMLKVGPNRESIFELFLTGFAAFSKVPVVILTSSCTHEMTCEFLEDHGNFGVADSNLHVIKQQDVVGWCKRSNGELYTPDGHGGLFEALLHSNTFFALTKTGVESMSVVQVDNPFVGALDLGMIGLHEMMGDEVTAKVVRRNHKEPCSVVVSAADCTEVIDWREIKDESESDDPGYGFINHLIMSLDFMAKAALDPDKYVPFHTFMSDEKTVKERVIMDVIRMTPVQHLWFADRDIEFHPIKTNTGEYSLEVARKLLGYPNE